MSYQSLIPIPDFLAELDSNSILANPEAASDFPIAITLDNGDLFFGNVGGTILTETITNGGSGLTDGSYPSTPAAGGTGTGALYDVTVSGGAVTGLTLVNGGTGYSDGDTLTFPSITGSGSEVITVDTTTADDFRFNVNVFTGAGTQGLVPDPGVSSGLFLRDDGTWAGMMGGQTAIQFRDEGIDQGGSGAIDVVDFVGNGVTAVAAGTTLTVTVPGEGAPTQITTQRTVTTADALVAGSDYLLYVDASGGGFNVDLPAASSGQWKFIVKKIDGLRGGANSVTVTAAGADLIDGETFQRLRRYDSLTFVSNGTDTWSII